METKAKCQTQTFFVTVRGLTAVLEFCDGELVSTAPVMRWLHGKTIKEAFEECQESEKFVGYNF